MKRVYQTRFGIPGEYCKEGGNCLAACVASILDQNLQDIPELLNPDDNYYINYGVFFNCFKLNNKKICWYGIDDFKILNVMNDANLDKPYILVGYLDKDKKRCHARVGFGPGLTIIHDPNPHLIDIEYHEILGIFAEPLNMLNFEITIY